MIQKYVIMKLLKLYVNNRQQFRLSRTQAILLE